MDRSLTRRGFIASAVSVAAGAAFARSASAAQQNTSNAFGNFNVGIQSYTFRNFNLEQALQRIADLGVRNVELFRGHVPVNATEAQLNAAKNLLRSHNITPIAFGVERFTRDDAANRRVFEFAKNLGVRYLSADPDPDSFDSLDRMVNEFDIKIAIHPHGPSGQGGRMLHRWYSAEVILQAVRSHDRRIGTCLDTGHLIRSAQAPHNLRLDPAQQIRAMGARNFGIHLKDHNNERKTDVVFGRDGGVLNVDEVLRALREVNFQGYMSVEYEANPNDPTADVRACLDIVRESVRRLG